jgi:hypothetical protein
VALCLALSSPGPNERSNSQRTALRAIRLAVGRESGDLWSVLVLLFRSRVSLEAEILILRHQLNIQQRHLPKRLTHCRGSSISTSYVRVAVHAIAG